MGTACVAQASEREVQISVGAALLQLHGTQQSGPGGAVQVGLAYDPVDWLGLGCRLQGSHLATGQSALFNAPHQRLLFASRAATVMPYFALKPPAQLWAAVLPERVLAELQMGLMLGCQYDSHRVHLYKECFVNRHAPAWRAALHSWLALGLAMKVTERWAWGLQAGVGIPVLADAAWQPSVGMQVTYLFYR
jgi:hypothetical protein